MQVFQWYVSSFHSCFFYELQVEMYHHIVASLQELVSTPAQGVDMFRGCYINTSTTPHKCTFSNVLLFY